MRGLGGRYACPRSPGQHAGEAERHWTVTAYVAHIADNLRIWAERLAGITLGGPAAVGAYDENELANARSYSAMSFPAACWSLDRATNDWGDAVRMAPVDLAMIHPERGRLGRDEIIRSNAHDAAHHTWDIERTLAATR